jgi:uncharacterized protein (DUF362 family)
MTHASACGFRRFLTYDDSMQRRTFLQAGLAATAYASTPGGLPSYRTVSTHQPAGQPMPGRYPGQVVAVHSERCIDVNTAKADAATVAAMVKAGMGALTGHNEPRDAWSSFFSPSDIIGIKVNCSGAPGIMSSPVVVAEIVKNLTAVGVPPSQIYIYERFPDQMKSAGYDKFVPAGINIHAAEMSRASLAGYDPKTYVEVNFFGEEDTRSNLIRLVSEKFTKIINVPNMKDHQAAGVTGCLKNIAYGNFSNVARSHSNEKTNTYSFIGTLAMVEPLRSKTVLNVMDGLKGVWHGGPFSYVPKFRFYPKQILFGTDPVAMDHQLIEVIDAKRKAEGAVSVLDRSMTHVSKNPGEDPNLCHFVREAGHIEFAGKLGLGVFDSAKIKKQTLNV